MKLKSILLTAVATLGLTTATIAQVTVTISANGSTTICSGNSVQLTGVVSPSSVYQYQWVRNGTNISGANGLNHTVNTSGDYFLIVTDLSSNVYNSNTINVTVNSLPPAPNVTYNSPAIICNGGSINLADNNSTNVSYQWQFNNSIINNATNSNYNANSSGNYKLVITDLATGCSNTSQDIIVGEMPNINSDTIVTCGNSTTISLTNSNFIYSTLPSSCNVNMSGASIISGTVTGGAFGGRIVCFGGNLTIDGSGSGTIVVEYGGTLNGFGGGGSNTAYIKAGGIYNFNSGGGGGNVVYYEPGAIINAGTTTTVQCNSIGVIYPSNTTALCNNLTYQWSNGATTPTITVNPTVPTTYSVTVSNGSISCTDTVLVTPNGVTPTISASGSTTFCQGGSVVLTSSSATGNTWSNGATTQSITVSNSGNYSVTVSNGSCSVTSSPTVVTVSPAPNTSITPQTNSLTTGSTATFTATTSSPNPNYVWQSDFGQGFQTLNNFGNYSGVNAVTLNIANVQLSEHNQPLRVISTSANCIDTSNIAVINILDTCLVTVYDTLLTTVTDTLVINTQITSLNPPNNLNTLKVYPNPASTHITIDYGNFNAMSGYTLTIVNSIGQTVFTTPISQQTSYIDLSTWTGTGIYFVQLIDPQNNTIENRKIVIQ